MDHCLVPSMHAAVISIADDLTMESRRVMTMTRGVESDRGDRSTERREASSQACSRASPRRDLVEARAEAAIVA
jgi:hypothetical protein